jgi:asparagine synthase (glutamine-hydrolysing)
MEFCLALPPEQKLQAGWGRSILRRAMQGVLPPQIQWRNTKADLSPNFHRSILGFGKEKLDRLFSEIDGPVVERFLDLSALKVVYRRYQNKPSNSDAMTLFMAATFAKWLGENCRQIGSATNGHARDSADSLFAAKTKGSVLDGSS